MVRLGADTDLAPCSFDLIIFFPGPHLRLHDRGRRVVIGGDGTFR